MSNRIKDATLILKSLHAPDNVLNERSALVLLALANITPNDKWVSSTNPRLGIVGNKKGRGYPGIMQFMAEKFQKKYAENSRETIRRNDIHTFIQLGIVEKNADDPSIPTNSSKNHYSLIPEFLEVIKLFGNSNFDTSVEQFIKSSKIRNRRYKRKTLHQQIKLLLPGGTEIHLSAGAHNELQARVVGSFRKHFAQGTEVLYIGDTADKYLHIEIEKLNKIGIDISKESHTKLPDVVLFDSKKQWLYLIKAVTSHGPISNQRIHILEQLISNTNCGVIYVTAFLNRNDFRKFSADIAWESEVWIATEPSHMIHFNGDRFIGPR